MTKEEWRMSDHGMVLLCAVVLRQISCCVLVTAEGCRAEWEGQLREFIRLGQFMEKQPGECATEWWRPGTEDADLSRKAAEEAAKEVMKTGKLRSDVFKYMGSIDSVRLYELKLTLDQE